MENTKISFAQINLLEAGNVLTPYNITTFPHLMLFQGYDDVRMYHDALDESQYVP